MSLGASTSSDSAAFAWSKEARAVERRFLDFFRNLGFKEWAEEPLIPRSDSSLRFTNAHIVGLKGILVSEQFTAETGFVMRQPCLRMHNLKGAGSRGFIPNYCSYFHMIGCLVPPRELTLAFQSCWRFLHRIEGISRDRIVYKCSGETQFASQILSELSGDVPEISWDCQPPKFYRWTYGMKDVQGLGITVSLRNMDDGRLEDIGNIVQIFDSERILGYEFGFGSETFVARKYSLRSPLVASITANEEDLQNPEFDCVRDLAHAAYVMIVAGVRPGSRGRGRVLRDTLKSLHKNADWSGVSTKQIESLWGSISSLEWRGGGLHSEITANIFKSEVCSR